MGPHPEPWPEDDRLDPELLAGGDRRNVIDRFRYWRLEAIVAELDRHRAGLHVAIQNWEHDFNIGSIVRTANAFNVGGVHIVGRRRWNRRGAMVTDRYLHVHHHEDEAALFVWLAERCLAPVGGGQPARGRAPRNGAASAWLLSDLRFGRAWPDRDDGGGLRSASVDHSARLHPVAQCRGRGRHRDVPLEPATPPPGSFGTIMTP